MYHVILSFSHRCVVFEFKYHLICKYRKKHRVGTSSGTFRKVLEMSGNCTWGKAVY